MIQVRSKIKFKMTETSADVDKDTLTKPNLEQYWTLLAWTLNGYPPGARSQ